MTVAQRHFKDVVLDANATVPLPTYWGKCVSTSSPPPKKNPPNFLSSNTDRKKKEGTKCDVCQRGGTSLYLLRQQHLLPMVSTG